MEFNDWNAYGCDVSASLIEQTALAMHDNGMQAAGYKYVNIDDCWMAGRGADGHLIADPGTFPPSAPGRNDGIKVVAGYVHSLGLKLGIYQDTGTGTATILGSYINHVKAQSGRQLSTALARQLIAGAGTIQALLRC